MASRLAQRSAAAIELMEKAVAHLTAQLGEVRGRAQLRRVEQALEERILDLLTAKAAYERDVVGAVAALERQMSSRAERAERLEAMFRAG